MDFVGDGVNFKEVHLNASILTQISKIQDQPSRGWKFRIRGSAFNSEEVLLDTSKKVTERSDFIVIIHPDFFLLV